MHHEHHTPFALAAQDCSSAELLSLLLLALSSAWMVGCHPLSEALFHLINTWLAVEDHCGYNLPWALHRLLPCLGGAPHHHAHHSVQTINYAPLFTHWDHLFGTCRVLALNSRPDWFACWFSSKGQWRILCFRLMSSFFLLKRHVYIYSTMMQWGYGAMDCFQMTRSTKMRAESAPCWLITELSCCLLFRAMHFECSRTLAAPHILISPQCSHSLTCLLGEPKTKTCLSHSVEWVIFTVLTRLCFVLFVTANLGFIMWLVYCYQAASNNPQATEAGGICLQFRFPTATFKWKLKWNN